MPGSLASSASRRDFDAAYQGTPPWEIGTPQPALAELARRGLFRGRILDVGCGTGEHALLAAGLGLEATGLDSSPRAIAIAQDKADRRGLPARFLVGNALDLGSLGERFDTVVDSGLFHVFDDERRADYVQNLGLVTPCGSYLLLLCFSDQMPGEFGPRRVTESELRTSFAAGWTVESLDRSRMQVTFAPEGANAWLAVVTRVPPEPV
jgi:cyclopropane fatty-acyl-phospholipid synthase-like methyltransferase